MNTNTTKKLMFSAFASTLLLTQQSNTNATEYKVNIDTGLPPLIFESTKEAYTSFTYEELVSQTEEYVRLKKQEEERLESLKTYIYVNSNDLRVKSDVTVKHLQHILKGTALEHLAQDFIDAQEIYNVNAIFLTALAANESGWGTSWLAVNKNNLTGYMAYPGQERDAKYFASKRDSIMRTAQLVSEDYLEESGKYHKGYSLESVNVFYCQYGDGSTNYNWSNTIKSLMEKFSHQLVEISEMIKEDEEAVTLVFWNAEQL